MSLYARREPYPFHIRISGRGFLIGTPKPGTPAMVLTRTQDISQVQPPDFSYASVNPTGDREEPYESMVYGMGLSLQDGWQDERYLSARGVDLSVWPWCLGPEVIALTPATHDATVGITKFFELGNALYAANGRYVLRRDSDATWSMVKDFGTDVILDVVVFTSNFDGVQRAFFALRDGVAQWTANGTVYTAFPTFKALTFAAVGQEWWWADDVNQLRKCDTNADPTLEANYTTDFFRAGDKSSAITALLVTAGGALLIAKTDGIYSLDSSGSDHPMYPFLNYAELSTNGKVWGTFENDLYVSYGNSLGKIAGDFSWSSVGLDTLVDNTSEVTGRITAFAGVETMFAWAGAFDPDTQTGFLCKYGGWAPNGTTPSALTRVQSPSTHIDAWHGALAGPFPNRAIQQLFVSNIGAPAGHTRTYVGFSDGTVGYLVNACTPNPVGCSVYRYSVGDHYVDLARWHATYHATVKSLRSWSVTAPFLDATDTVTLEYRVDQATAWSDFGFVFDGPETYEKHDFPITTSGVLASFRVHLHNTVNTKTPLVSAVTIGHALRPPRIMQFECDVLCADGLVRRDGVPLRIGRKEIQRLIEAAVDYPGAVDCVLPDETSQKLSITDYSISQSFDEIGRQWHGSLHLKMVQWSTDAA